MANICSNTFYACSEDRQNIDTIINFFHDWPYAEIEDSDTSVDVYFDSKRAFPEKEMTELYDLIPNKDDLYARCLSVEYGMDYVAYWKCNEEGWYQEV